MATRWTPGSTLPPSLGIDLIRVMEIARSELDELAADRPKSPSWSHDAPWAWFGSVVLLMHEIEIGRRPSDLDVFVDPWVWVQLVNAHGWEVSLPDPADPPFARRHVYGVDVCAFYRWTTQDPEVNADHCRITAECMFGHYVTPLLIVRTHKAMSGKHEGPRWEKHRTDVAAIDAHLAAAT
jgi:hypothetical protein